MDYAKHRGATHQDIFQFLRRFSLRPKQPDLPKILHHALTSFDMQKGQLADEIGVSGSTMSRLLRGETLATMSALESFAKFCGIDIKDTQLGFDHFLKILQYGEKNSLFMLHSLSTVKENISQCRKIEKNYTGQYLVFYKSLESVVVSLMSIGKTTKNGISVKIINPHRGSDGIFREFVYTGYMLPVGEFLYFACEQINMRYELLTMILHSSPTDEPTFLRGILSGIGVRDATKSVASISVYLQKQTRPLNKLQLSKKIKYSNLGETPAAVQKFIRNCPGPISIK